MSEKTRLAAVSAFYDAPDGLKATFGGMHARMIAYDFRALRPFFRGTTALELGIGDGEMTGHLVGTFASVVGVDGSPAFVQAVRARYADALGRLTLVESLFEEFQTDARFDTVLALHILEHVADPVALLKRASGWLANGGVLLVLVPNARSLHRRAAVKMGLLGAVDDLSAIDLRLGHRRVYTAFRLATDLAAAGLQIVETGGVFLKPLSNAQIDQTWDDALIDAFAALGAELPTLASELYAVCEVSC